MHFTKAVKVSACALLACFSAAGFAGFSGPGGHGAVLSASTAVNAKEDSPVQLEGYIIEQVGQERYHFIDASGDLMLEIEDKQLEGINLTATDLVRVYGEVEHEDQFTLIEVDRIEVERTEIR